MCCNVLPRRTRANLVINGYCFQTTTLIVLAIKYKKLVKMPLFSPTNSTKSKGIYFTTTVLNKQQIFTLYKQESLIIWHFAK